MFGRNKVAKQSHDPNGSLSVKECFYTIQGEGPDAGEPAIFLRLAGCNLRCFFCDTDFENGQSQEAWEVLERIRLIGKGHKCRLVVITGGEPLLQNIAPLTVLLNQIGYRVSVETAGTVYHQEFWSVFKGHGQNKIVCSPKTPQIAKGMVDIVHAWKYIIRCGDVSLGDGLPIMSTQLEGDDANIFRPPAFHPAPVFLQPMDERDEKKNKANQRLTAMLCMMYGYRLSIQMHKIVDVP